MKGRETKAAAPSADLLVCFPSRAHLNLMPKAICSPGKASESSKRRHHKRSSTRGGDQASPLLWAKPKSMGSEIVEPTSPKVTCAGQIKVTQKASACRNWESVMQEIDNIHNDGKQRKRSNWAQSLGFKREIMQFLTCLRSIRLDLRCFGSFPEPDITTEDEDEEDDEHEDEGFHVGIEESDNDTSGTDFSKWFMMLQENQNNDFHGEATEDKVGDDGSMAEPAVPPPNALLLMRCRSAPAKSWLKENEVEDKKNEEQEEGKKSVDQFNGQSLKSLMEEEKTKKENLVMMTYGSDFYKVSSDIAKETWIVGGLRDALSKSRSWKR